MVKHTKMHASKSQLVLVLMLIGGESDMFFFPVTEHDKAKPRQISFTFDIQLNTAQFETNFMFVR